MASYHIRGELEGAPVDLAWARTRVGRLTPFAPSVGYSQTGRTEIWLQVDADSARHAAEVGAGVIESAFRSPLAAIEVRATGAA